MKNNNNMSPDGWKKILQVIIAVLAALAGAIGESTTHILGNVFHVI